jgi:signal transduction histidine kinase
MRLPPRVAATAHELRDALGAQLVRLPIRARLTLAFAATMIVLLGGLALLLYTRFEAGLNASINGSLQTRAAELAVVARGGASGHLAGRPRLPESAGGFAQILTTAGAVLDSTPGLARRPLLNRDELAQALRAPKLFDFGEHSEVLARSTSTPQGAVVVVAGTSLSEREHALNTLGDLLFIGGPVMLLLACAAGYALTARALAPVEGMRRRAAEISGGEPNERLPVPVARDELHRLGETLNGMLERLEAAVARERAFVADASHELRTPLAILKLELDLALSGERSHAQLATAVRSAREEVDRLTRLAEDLLVIARADQGALPVQRRPVEVPALLASIATRHNHSGEGKPPREVVLESAEPLTLEADVTRLEQALGNLVENAMRHGAGPVVLRASASNGNVELHVLDSGPGFPPAFVPSAFERFARADAARTGGGTGLGLAIVRAIAEAHGGSAQLENRAEGGAHVWLTLPRTSE